MKTQIISIGNSRGIRIPKPILEESGLSDEVELKVKKGEIKLIPVRPNNSSVVETTLLSEASLARDWNQPEEDEAWANL